MSMNELDQVGEAAGQKNKVDDGISAAAAQAWSAPENRTAVAAAANKPEQSLASLPDLLLNSKLENKVMLEDKLMLEDKIILGDKLQLGDKKLPIKEVSGLVEFSKQGQEQVNLKGFSYTQNQDGSIVTRQNGNTFVVAPNNTLTVVRENGAVETYKPTVGMYKDGGSIGYGYPPEAGFNLTRKHRGMGAGNVDTGVEISVGGAQFTTQMLPGRAGTFSYDTSRVGWKKSS